jgi:septum formation protein
VKIILASKSPRRQDILRKAGIKFTTFTPFVTEVNSGIYYRHIPLFNAVAKASEVATAFPEALVIGADTVIEYQAQTIGKPASLQHAYEILKQLSGNTHQVVSGICLICKKLNLKIVFADTTLVSFKNLSAETITAYLQKVEVLDKAGAYAIQEHSDMLVANINGSINNVIGLPIERLIECLQLYR